jgi:nucleotide-binding universal stress UspA family protein
MTLAHVMQPRHESGGLQRNDALSWEISRQEAQGYLERVQRETAQALGRPVEMRLEQGHPAERIVDLARELGADLTMLGSHGEAGATPWNLGSTAQQVLAVARGSIFVAHSLSGAKAVVSPQRILVPLDGSVRTESALPTAARMAEAYGAELLLVHVVQEPLATSVLRAAEDLDLARMLATRLASNAKHYLDGLRNQLLNEVASVRTLVARHANEHQCLLEIAQRERTDLIVLSAHGSACDSAQCFGSVTAYLLTHLMVPLLALQDLPDRAPLRAPDVDARPAPPLLRASYAPESV